mmetsp:Transcript_24574/g.54100  ORF Transcript_24574/g.54100 Transcript_24574/m.54100 type:complete len:158 (+) Transcript_24574:1255-1728(+)
MSTKGNFFPQTLASTEIAERTIANDVKHYEQHLKSILLMRTFVIAEIVNRKNNNHVSVVSNFILVNITMVDNSHSNSTIDVGRVPIGINKPLVVAVEFVKPVNQQSSSDKRFRFEIVMQQKGKLAKLVKESSDFQRVATEYNRLDPKSFVEGRHRAF